jgi:hypothetical protein
VSEQPEQPPSFPLSPDELHRLEEIARSQYPSDMINTAIEAIAGIHVRWYKAWQAAGAPEHRAAEWAGIMIATQHRQS